MTNATWVCFDCRQVVRSPTRPRRAVPCPLCRTLCICLGRPVPPKSKVVAWRRLKERVRPMVGAFADFHERERARIEKRLRSLEREPNSPLVQGEIEDLRRQLAGG